jgi:lambda family phage portal protein
MMEGIRRRIGAFIGGFDGGLSTRRLKGFQASRAHVNVLIQQAGDDMTARARYLTRNNGYAINAVESWAGNVVGTGIKPSSKIPDASLKDKVQRLWLRWTDEADSEGLTDFYGLQRRAAREVFIAGEVFFRIRPRRDSDGLTVPLQLQLLPSEMLPKHLNQTLGGGHVIRQGIEFDAIGRRAAYHFYRRHPGDSTEPGLTGETVRVPADSILHIIDPVDAGQLRGYSRFAPVLAKLFILDQYDDAELDRKKVAAMFAGFVTRPALDDMALDADGSQSEPLMPLEPGQLQVLEDGENITFSSPSDVGGNYESFQYRTLLQVASGLGIPYANVTSDMVKANYSNTRAALLEFRRRIEAVQHSVMVYQMCRPVWIRWMDAAVMCGALKITDYEKCRPDYLDCEWLPPRWDWVDPQKDIIAEVAAINAGLKSRSQAISERGYDASAVDAEIAEDRRRQRELGILTEDSNDRSSPSGVNDIRDADYDESREAGHGDDRS